MAGGVFIVPILTIFGHLDIRTAIGASIVSVIACSCGSAAAFLKNQLTNIRLALVLEVATTLGALTGAVLVGVIPGTYLFFLFSFILVISAQQMLAKRKIHSNTSFNNNNSSGWGAALRLNSSYPDHTLQKEVPYQVYRLPLGFILMYGAGLISALLGIGSGVLKIPAMDSALRLPIKVSSATSNFMIGVTATASAGAYFLRGDIVPNIAGPVAMGSVLGSVLGAKVLLAISSERIRILFAIVLLALAVQMFCSALGVKF